MKTYYNDTPRKVTFENKSIDLSDAKAYFLALSAHKDSYIGFVDVYNDVIVYRWVTKNKWLIDHPVVSNTLHRQRYATNEECLDFIKKVYQEHVISNFEGFVEVPVGEFTLDEMLAFKAEDEALLREEELPVTPKKGQSQTIQKRKNAKRTFLLGDEIEEQKDKKNMV